MVDIFYEIEKASGVIPIRRIRTIVWYILKYVLNFLAPHYYRFNPIKKGRSSRIYTKKQVIISITTFPDRMKTLPLVLESLFRQTISPDRIILWLADSQFSDKKKVSSYLSKYICLGLEVKYCEDLRSHKKYFYTMKYYPDSLVVTFDDDIFAPEYMLERLLTTHNKYPNCIVTQRAHKFRFGDDGKMLSYKKVIYLARGCQSPSLNYCITGGFGCLYPPYSLSPHVFDLDILKEKCLFADDIWLTCMAYMHGTKVVLTGMDNPEIIDVLHNKRNGLALENVINNRNDFQLIEVTKYFKIKWQYDNE